MAASANPTIESDEKYQVVASLGRGGTADVSLAVLRGPAGFNKLVVLKSLRENFRGDEKFSESFMREARLNALLSHPHIVQTIEVFEFDELPVIVMEYLEGPSLSAAVRMARRRAGATTFDRRMHLRVLSDILSALQYTHEKHGLDGHALGLVHCDVTPQNVLLTYEGEVKLIDFGIAQQISSEQQVTAGKIKGKSRYMPSEQLGGVGVDRRTDIYAVGIMAWEAAAGVRLWEGDSDEQIMLSVMGGNVPPPSSITTDVAPELERIVMRALAPDKRHRYSSARQMQADLDAFLGEAGPHLRGHDIGKAMVGLFGDRRKETRALVAAQLKKLEELPVESLEEAPPPELPPITTPSLFPENEPRKTTAARGGIKIALVAIFVVVSGITMLVVRSPSETSPQHPSPQEDFIQLTVVAEPDHATISLDGRSLGVNPYIGKRRASARKHRIIISADGYVTAERTMSLTTSTHIVVNLAKQQAAETSAPTLKARAYRPATLPPDRKDSDCDPPAYFDKIGIKHFKPHCL